MKKLLSVLLAVLMLFSVMAVSASAAAPITNRDVALDKRETLGSEHYVICYDLGNFKLKYPIRTFDVETGTIASIEGITGKFYQIPLESGQYTMGYEFTLPEVVAPDGRAFNGWLCKTAATGSASESFGANQTIKITPEMVAKCDYDNVIIFSVLDTNAEAETDTMAKVIDILCRIFGAIYGLLFCNGDTELGIKTVQEMLGGILG